MLAKSKTPSPKTNVNITPTSTPRTKDRKKNLDSLFGRHSNPLVVSQIFSKLKQHLPEGTDHKASTKAIVFTIKAMYDEGQLPEDELMEDVSSECQMIDVVENNFT